MENIRPFFALLLLLLAGCNKSALEKAPTSYEVFRVEDNEGTRTKLTLTEGYYECSKGDKIVIVVQHTGRYKTFFDSQLYLIRRTSQEEDGVASDNISVVLNEKDIVCISSNEFINQNGKEEICFQVGQHKQWDKKNIIRLETEVLVTPLTKTQRHRLEIVAQILFKVIS